jgi:hypothetical protein
MQNILGKNRTVKATKQFASPEYFSLTGVGGRGLVQQVRAAFARRIDSIYVVGDTSVYWGFQGGEGSLSISRFVGTAFFSGSGGSACGIISSVTGGVTGSECSAGGAKVTFEQLALQDVGFQVTAGETTIVETLNYKVGNLGI